MRVHVWIGEVFHYLLFQYNYVNKYCVKTTIYMRKMHLIIDVILMIW